MPLPKTESWTTFTTAELREKLTTLRKLIDSGTLTARSEDHQVTEIAFIESELAKRDGP